MERVKDARQKAVLELAASKGNWGRSLPTGWGRGIASYATWGVSPTAEVVELSVAEDGTIQVQRVVCAIDCGIVINPDMVTAQVEGGIVYTLSAALKHKITLENGRIKESNFHNYQILRIDEMPVIEVYLVPSQEPPTGVGEMSGPPLTPAVANAVFAAKVAQVGAESFTQFERVVLLQSMDTHCRERLSSLDYLRQWIHLRGDDHSQPKQ